MKKSLKVWVVLLVVISISSCQAKKDQPQTVSAGNIFTGEMKGHLFSIAAGDEYETFMKVKKAFNNRDADAIWKYSADTVAYHVSGGGTVPLTRDYMADFFGSLDSLKWEMNSVLPVKITNSDQVEILVDSRETLYYNDGTIDNTRLFERFVFNNKIIVAVYQWTAEVGNAE